MQGKMARRRVSGSFWPIVSWQHCGVVLKEKHQENLDHNFYESWTTVELSCSPVRSCLCVTLPCVTPSKLMAVVPYCPMRQKSISDSFSERRSFVCPLAASPGEADREDLWPRPPWEVPDLHVLLANTQVPVARRELQVVLLFSSRRHKKDQVSSVFKRRVEPGFHARAKWHGKTSNMR